MYKLVSAALLALALASSAALAQTVSPPGVPIGGGIACAYNSATPTLTAGTAGWVQCDSSGKLIVIPGTAAPGTFVGLVGGFNAIISNTPTVQNAAYSASNAIGGFQQIAVFRSSAQPSGIIDYISVASKGGSTTALTIYAFNKSSANLSSTCTDKSAFSLNSADLSALIPGFPVTLTPATTQGTTVTSASQSVVVSAKNADGTPSTNITLCAVVGGSVTPASTSDLVFNLALVQD